MLGVGIIVVDGVVYSCCVVAAVAVARCLVGAGLHLDPCAILAGSLALGVGEHALSIGVELIIASLFTCCSSSRDLQVVGKGDGALVLASVAADG